jgi:hypothetical protein
VLEYFFTTLFYSLLLAKIDPSLEKGILVSSSKRGSHHAWTEKLNRTVTRWDISLKLPMFLGALPTSREEFKGNSVQLRLKRDECRVCIIYTQRIYQLLLTKASCDIIGFC